MLMNNLIWRPNSPQGPLARVRGTALLTGPNTIQRSLRKCCILLRDKLSSKATNRIQLNSIGEHEHQFLHAGRFEGRYTLAKRIGGSNKALIYSIPAPDFPHLWNQSLRLLIGFANDAERRCSTMNILIVSPNGFTMLL